VEVEELTDKLADWKNPLTGGRLVFPFVAWDWDGTFSANGVNAVGQAVEVVHSLFVGHGYLSIIVSGRTENPCPDGIKGWSSKVWDGRPLVLWNYDSANSYRFKFWCLRKLYNNARGPLKLYIDNDVMVQEALKSGNKPVPVCGIEGFDCYRYTDWMRVYRRLRWQPDPRRTVST
jgi:hypothetical protein